LAVEAFEYLLGSPHLDGHIHDRLWSYNRRGGFEEVLAYLQTEYTQRRDASSQERLTKLQPAVAEMFADIDAAFAAITNFGFQNDRAYLVRSRPVRFDAISTLNQE
jgi:hypothetical protein